MPKNLDTVRPVTIQSLIAGKKRKGHGLRWHPIYRSHTGMLQRCYNPKNPSWKYYGGRGIGVCERWLEFEKFAQDMLASWRPGLSLERRDNNGDYTPENVYWATRYQQANNMRKNVRVTINGITKTVKQWSKIVGAQSGTIFRRIYDGWTPEEAVTTPIRACKTKGLHKAELSVKG